MSRIKPIKGFENYCITDDGRVLSHGQSHTRWKKRRWKNTSIQNSGYLIVHLYKNGVHHTKTIHRLVAEHFIPNPENKKEVNHKNGDKMNNSISNLEWMTSSENKKHSIRNNLWTPKYNHLEQYRGQPHNENTRKKIANRKTKISKKTAKEIRQHILNKTMTYAQIRQKYKVGGGTMNMCRDNTFKIYNLEE